MSPDLDSAIERISSLQYSLAMGKRHFSAAVLAEMLSDLESAVGNARAIALKESTIDLTQMKE